MDDKQAVVSSAYQILFQQSDDGVIVVDKEYHIIVVNPLAEHILDLKSDDLEGKALASVLQTAFDKDVLIEDLSTTQLSNIHNDVTYVYEIDVKSLGDQVGHLVLLKDKTEVINLRKDYIEFAHTVSHDVKAPLGVAVGYSNMLQTELEAGTEQRFFVDEIFNTTMRIMNICNELVLLSDLEHQQGTETMPVDMRFVTENAMRRFQHLAEERDVTLSFPEKSPFAHGNAPWIEEVIVDFLYYALIDNPSSQTILIEVTVTDSGMLRFEITHDGTDKPVNNLEAMLAEEVDLQQIRIEGYGLGLNVAKRLIERLDGEIEVINNKTLAFTLPLVLSNS